MRGAVLNVVVFTPLPFSHKKSKSVRYIRFAQTVGVNYALSYFLAVLRVIRQSYESYSIGYIIAYILSFVNDKSFHFEKLCYAKEKIILQKSTNF